MKVLANESDSEIMLAMAVLFIYLVAMGWFFFA